MQCSAQGLEPGKVIVSNEEILNSSFPFSLGFPAFLLLSSALFPTEAKICRSSLPLLTSLVSLIAQEVGGVGGMRTGLGTHARTHVCTHMHPCRYTHLLHPCLDFVKIRKRTLHF